MSSKPPQSIPDWLLRRLRSISHTPPRYEASLYGPINGILATYFPPQQRFMVKPQGKVRPGYEYNVEEAERMSFDSYNQLVQPRGQGLGDESNVKIPDFIVVKGSPTLSNDIPLLIVEVKRDASDDDLARLQILDYMIGFGRKFETRQFKGVLIQGSKVYLFILIYDIITRRLQVLLYEWSTTAPFAPIVKKTLTVTDDTFLKWVREVAKANWKV